MRVIDFLCAHPGTKKESCFSQPSGGSFVCGSAFYSDIRGLRRSRFARLWGVRDVLEDSPQNILQIGEEVAAAHLFHLVHFQFAGFHFLILLPDRRHFLFSVPGVLPWTLIDTEQLTGWQRFLKEIYDNMNLLRWTQLFQASAGSDAQISPGCIVRAKAVVSRYHPETSSDQMAR